MLQLWPGELIRLFLRTLSEPPPPDASRNAVAKTNFAYETPFFLRFIIILILGGMLIVTALVFLWPLGGHGMMGAWILNLPHAASAAVPASQIPAIRRILEERGFRPASTESLPAFVIRGAGEVPQPPDYVPTWGDVEKVRL